MARGSGKGKSSIVIRKEEIIEVGHHGGAWKVAYADFVTAMMAFFLLMWLLNATTEDQRKGLADYFSPKNPISRAASGTGAPFGGHTPFDKGDLTSDRGVTAVIAGPSPPEDNPDDPTDTPTRVRQGDDVSPAAAAGTKSGPAAAAAAPVAKAALQEVKQAQTASGAAAAERQEGEAFKAAAEQIREAVRNDPKLADLARQLAIDITPDGLRIQIMDEDRRPMFATGSAVPDERARQLLQKVAPVLLKLSEPVSIAGHTDAAPYKGGDMSNWELSADRANATRRILMEAGLAENRLQSVTGDADRDPLLPAEPLAAANRRIAIMVLRSALPGAKPDPQAVPPAQDAPDAHRP